MCCCSSLERCRPSRLQMLCSLAAHCCSSDKSQPVGVASGEGDPHGQREHRDCDFPWTGQCSPSLSQCVPLLEGQKRACGKQAGPPCAAGGLAPAGLWAGEAKCSRLGLRTASGEEGGLLPATAAERPLALMVLLMENGEAPPAAAAAASAAAPAPAAAAASRASSSLSRARGGGEGGSPSSWCAAEPRRLRGGVFCAMRGGLDALAVGAPSGRGRAAVAAPRKCLTAACMRVRHHQHPPAPPAPASSTHLRSRSAHTRVATMRHSAVNA